jgi:transcriptional regulator with XRE-family HTH domain
MSVFTTSLGLHLRVNNLNAIAHNNNSIFAVKSDIINAIPNWLYNVCDMSSLIRQLRNIRIQKGLTQSELAERVGLPQSSIARIESERIDTRLSTFEELINTLGHEILIVPKEQVIAIQGLLAKPERYAELSEIPLYSLTDSDALEAPHERKKRKTPRDRARPK